MKASTARMVTQTLVVAGIMAILFPALAYAEGVLPSVTINTSSSSEVTNSEVYSGLKLSFLVSSLVFLPSIVMTTTCFTRIAIVLAMTRQALGVGNTPPNQVLLALSLFLSFVVMEPVLNEIYTKAVVPYTEEQITHQEALKAAFSPLRSFMLRQTREQDLGLFLEITKTKKPETPADLSPLVVIPAFVISELNTAFQISFLIFVPFLVLDMIISSVLTSMSMITLPPTIISLPIKLLLFVVIDGWHLIIGNLIKTYNT